MAATTVLRPGLLDGIAVLLAGAEPPSRFGEAVTERCAELGAELHREVVDPTADQQQQVANEIFAQIRGLYAELDSLGRKGVARSLREARRAARQSRATA